jgi:hypothetical protein
VDAAALPGAAEHLRDRLLQAGVRVGDDQLHAVEAALEAAAQEGAPERLRLRLADVEGDHLAVAGLVHAVGEHERFPDDAAAVADLLDLGVEPQVRVAASSGRLRQASTCSSRPAQIRETSLFEIRSPSDSTTWSTLRVDTPAT